jgi:hypothetical protein
MNFAFGITALLTVGASAFAPATSNVRSSSLFSTAEKTYTFAKSEEIFAEAKEVCNKEIYDSPKLYRYSTTHNLFSCL